MAADRRRRYWERRGERCAARLRLRAGPGTSYTILDVMPPGTIVPVLARTGSGAWVQVEYGGRVGWMYSGLMTIYGDLGALPVG